MCCGHRRSEWQSSQAPLRDMQRFTPADTRPRPATPIAEPLPHSSLTLLPAGSLPIRYVDTLPIRVRGLMTGRSYEFSAAQPVQSVDASDAASLLNTRYFRRVESEAGSS